MKQPEFNFFQPNRLVFKEGVNWKKEVQTPKDETDKLKAGEKSTSNVERLKFYKDFAENRLKLGKEVWEEMAQEESTAERFKLAGLMTREDLVSKEKEKGFSLDRDIKSGDNLYEVMEDYFKALGVTDSAQLKKEVTSTLPYMQNQTNIDKLYVGGHIRISEGKLYVEDAKGNKQMDGVKIKPSLGAASSAPSTAPNSTVDDSKQDAVEADDSKGTDTFESSGDWMQDRLDGEFKDNPEAKENMEFVIDSMQAAKELLKDFDFSQDDLGDIADMKLAQITNPTVAWSKNGLFKNDKERRIKLQKLWDRDKSGDRAKRFGRQIWRTHMTEYLQDQLMNSSRENKSQVMVDAMAQWKGKATPEKALLTGMYLDKQLLDKDYRAALAKLMDASEASGSFNETAKGLPGLKDKQITGIDMHVVTGGGMVKIQEGMWNEFEFKNAILEDNRIYAQMKNGCEGNLVIIDLEMRDMPEDDGGDSDRAGGLDADDGDRAGGLDADDGDRAGGLDADDSDRAGGLDADDSDRAGGLDADDGDRAGGLDADDGDRAGGLDADDGDRAGGLDADDSDRAGGLDADDSDRAGGLDASGADRAGGIDADIIAQDRADEQTDEGDELGLPSDRAGGLDAPPREHYSADRAGGLDSSGADQAGGIDADIIAQDKADEQTDEGDELGLPSDRAGGLDAPPREHYSADRAGGLDSSGADQAGGIDADIIAQDRADEQTDEGDELGLPSDRAGGLDASGADQAGGLDSAGDDQAGGLDSSGADRAGGIDPTKNYMVAPEGAADQAGGLDSAGDDQAGGLDSSGADQAGGIDATKNYMVVPESAADQAGGLDASGSDHAGGIDATAGDRAGGIASLNLDTNEMAYEPDTAGGLDATAGDRASGIDAIIEKMAGDQAGGLDALTATDLGLTEEQMDKRPAKLTGYVASLEEALMVGSDFKWAEDYESRGSAPFNVEPVALTPGMTLEGLMNELYSGKDNADLNSRVSKEFIEHTNDPTIFHKDAKFAKVEHGNLVLLDANGESIIPEGYPDYYPLKPTREAAVLTFTALIRKEVGAE
jgi:hypothetical protein